MKCWGGAIVAIVERCKYRVLEVIVKRNSNGRLVALVKQDETGLKEQIFILRLYWVTKRNEGPNQAGGCVYLTLPWSLGALGCFGGQRCEMRFKMLHASHTTMISPSSRHGCFFHSMNPLHLS